MNWVNEAQKTNALYWAGTYIASTDAARSYTWDSENDTAQTKSSLLASGDPTKTFGYSDGALSYDVGGRLLARRPSALAALEPRVEAIDDVDPSSATDDLCARLFLQRLDRSADLHHDLLVEKHSH